MSKLKVTTISDPDNDNTALTIDSSGNVNIPTTLDVTGTVTAENLTLDAGVGGPHLSFENQGGSTRIKETDNASFFYRAYTHTFESYTGVDRLDISQIGDISFYEDTGTTAKFFWDASTEALGIGTSSPAYSVDVSKAGTNQLRVRNENLTASGLRIGEDSSSSFIASDGTVPLVFANNGSERMRIDSSGNLLVGTTNTTFSNEGVRIHSGSGDSRINITRNNGTPLNLNRLTSNGELIIFYKDGTTAGKIGCLNTLTIGSNSTGLRFDYASLEGIVPWNMSTNSGRDNAIDLGYSAIRFDDIYATNGSIQTSDRNEKQQIASLTDAEMNVAKRLSALFKTFKWNSSVEEKGDNARTHSGIIAQDMQQAFTDEGLDAGNYAMFISSTWWEKEISVDAVEEETDEEGNVITEGQDAYTYMDTKEEATEGYTERTRLGVRYPELFAFINAYNDQRFEALETRITTLEGA